MGCHTWAYTKSPKQFTYKECKDKNNTISTAATQEVVQSVHLEHCDE